MTQTTEQVSLERRLAIMRSNQRFGLWSTLVGGLLLAATAILVAPLGVIATVGRNDDLDKITHTMSATASITPFILMLFALCALILGEQSRRGELIINPAPPATTLPSASVVSRFRMLSIRWHLVWVLVSAACAAGLLGPVIVGITFSVWPATLPAGAMVQGLWTVYGAVAFAATVATLQSLAKKISTLRALREGRKDSPHRRGWRFWLYRWRVGSWLGAAGGFAFALFGIFTIGAAADGDPAAGWLLLAAACGAVVAAAGFVLGMQFWRTGEDLGSSESYT